MIYDKRLASSLKIFLGPSEISWVLGNLLIVEEIQPNTLLLEATYIFKVDAELRLQLPKTSQFQQRHPAQSSRTH